MEARRYSVSWTIELDAYSAEHAALEALKIQRDHLNTATVFEVIGFETDEHGTYDMQDNATLEKAKRDEKAGELAEP